MIEYIKTFINWVAIPTFVIVLFAYARFENNSTGRMGWLMMALLYNFFSYGSVGIQGIVLLFNLDWACFDTFTFNYFNYIVILIFSLKYVFVMVVISILLVVFLCLLCFVR